MDEFVIGALPGVLLIVLLASCVLLRPVWIRHRTSSWPAVQGHVESAQVSTLGNRDRNIYVARLYYSYAIDGDWFSGSVGQTFSDEQKAYDFADAYKGKAILVRYNPSRPEKSVIWQ